MSKSRPLSTQRSSFDETRRHAIIRLLETMNDGLPTDPKGQWSSFGALPGEKATKRQPCRSCDETGSATTRKGVEPCGRCDGNGWFLVDAYTGRRENEPVTATSEVEARREGWRKRDEAIARVALQLRRPQSDRDEIADANASGGEPWERERRRMFKRYEYAALERALDVLRRCGDHRAQRAAAAAIGVYTYGYAEPSAALECDAELGLWLLGRLMPDPIRAPGVTIVEHPALSRIRRRAA